MEVKILREACIGCGACEATAKDVFNIDEEGIATADNTKINEENKDNVLEAISNCPTGAIEEAKND